MSIPTHALNLTLASQGVTSIKVAFQPIVGRSRAVWACEALLRGVDAHGAVIAPAGILRACVASGDVFELGGWVRHLALEQYGQMSRLGLAAHFVCLNARRDEVGPNDFVECLLASASAADVDPGRIIIELTEDVAEVELDVLLHRRSQIAEARMQLALDDCGPGGLNSPRVIGELRPEIVKVDMRLLTAPAMHNEVGAIIKSARDVGAMVVVERVEAEGHFSELLMRGVDLFQGRLFGMPMIQK